MRADVVGKVGIRVRFGDPMVEYVVGAIVVDQAVVPDLHAFMDVIGLFEIDV